MGYKQVHLLYFYYISSIAFKKKISLMVFDFLFLLNLSSSSDVEALSS